MHGIIRKLVEKTCYYRDMVPVFRIEPRSLSEQEELAVQFASGMVRDYEHSKSRISRANGYSNILFSEGVRARVYHPSGAIALKAGLGPMEHLIGENADKEALTQSVAAAAKRLMADRMASQGEKLAFERLWQIKAAGINSEGVRGRDVVCRAVGAFRRYLYDLPVWGRASVAVEIAGSERVSGLGIDWRPVRAEPFDHTKVIDPERGAEAVLRDLNSRLPGGSFGDDDFEIGMFSLGYISLPKRREQTVFAPVYVATLERRGWTTINYLVVVEASEKGYESVCRLSSSAQRDAVKPHPGSGKQQPGRDSGWDPFLKRPC